ELAEVTMLLARSDKASATSENARASSENAAKFAYFANTEFISAKVPEQIATFRAKRRYCQALCMTGQYADVARVSSVYLQEMQTPEREKKFGADPEYAAEKLLLLAANMQA